MVKGNNVTRDCLTPKPMVEIKTIRICSKFIFRREKKHPTGEEMARYNSITEEMEVWTVARNKNEYFLLSFSVT